MEKFIIQLRKQKIANGYWKKILSQEWGGRLRDGVKKRWMGLKRR